MFASVLGKYFWFSLELLIITVYAKTVRQSILMQSNLYPIYKRPFL